MRVGSSLQRAAGTAPTRVKDMAEQAGDRDRVSAWALAGAAAPRETGSLAVISHCMRAAPEAGPSLRARQFRGSGNARRVELGSVPSNLCMAVGRDVLVMG